MDGAAEVVPRSATTERDAVVGGALAVDDQVPEVGEGLAVFDADALPHRVGERLGGDHQRIQREDAAADLGELRPVALGGVDDRARSDRALDAARADPHDAVGPADHLGLLGDHRAAAFDRAGDAAHELAGVHPGAGRRDRGRHGVRDAVARADAFGAGEGDPVDAELLRLGELAPGGRELHPVARERHCAAADVVAVHALDLGDPADLVDGVDHRLPLGNRGIAPVAGGQR